MNLKVGQLVDARGALFSLGNEKLPVKLAYRIQRNIRKINPILDEFEEERLKLVHQYGEKEEKGGFKVKDENIEAYVADIKALREETEELDIRVICIDDLTVNVTPLMLTDLHWMFEDSKIEPVEAKA